MAERPTQEHTPDQLEQRQRLDGAPDETAVFDEASGEPLSPDMIEQRQDLGEPSPGGLVDAAGEPLSADMIEQRLVVADDEEWDDRGEE